MKSKNIKEIKKEGKMKVPGIIYASEKLLKSIENDKTTNQIKNVAELPGILKASMAMPDAHRGYGFCIGGVAAFDLKEGVISPGGVGYDINCGVRLLKTNLTLKDLKGKEKKLSEKLYEKIPSGVGRGSPFQLTYRELDEVLEKGVEYLIEKGYAKKEDLKHIEEGGRLKKSDSSKVSERAKKRGIGQLGTLGSGNHFLDVQIVEEIFDKKIAKKWDLKKDQLVVMVHCGSRGLGHQVASDYIKLMEEEYGIENLPDRELINAPIKSKLGKDYLLAMNSAANFAFANRQIVTHWTREVFEEIFPKSKVEIIYDVCHNIAKIEEYKINGKKRKVCVHRKGATRSFENQPVLIPGSMGTSSYILVGTKKAEKETFGSTAHGAGRVMGRKNAKENLSLKSLEKDLKNKKIIIKAGSKKTMLEESPEVYKDIEEVIKVVEGLGISKRVAKLKPAIVIIG
ncbi:MAG: RtcB family protein [Nanoarchaeota archaeon]|nr:RtcB family protein [Nanoarchaeota archaeon]